MIGGSRRRSSLHLRGLGDRAPTHPTKSAISRGPREWALKPASRGPALRRHAFSMHSSSRHPFLGSGRRSRKSVAVIGGGTLSPNLDPKRVVVTQALPIGLLGP